MTGLAVSQVPARSAREVAAAPEKRVDVTLSVEGVVAWSTFQLVGARAADDDIIAALPRAVVSAPATAYQVGGLASRISTPRGVTSDRTAVVIPPTDSVDPQ